MLLFVGGGEVPELVFTRLERMGNGMFSRGPLPVSLAVFRDLLTY